MGAVKRYLHDLADKLGKEVDEITDEDLQRDFSNKIDEAMDNPKPINFELTAEQTKKFQNWKSSKKKGTAAIGGAFTFCFTPTSIGVIVEAQHADGSKIDLTEDL